MKRPTKSITRREAPHLRLKPTLQDAQKRDRSRTQRVPGERIWCVKAQMTPSLSVEPPVFSKAVAHMQGGSKTTDDSAVEFLKKAGIIEKPGKLALSLSPIQT